MNINKFFFSRVTALVALILLVVEVASFLGFLYPTVNTAAFFFVTIATLVLALMRLEYGVLIVFAEIVVGSKGYLLSEAVSGFVVSIRLALFLAVFLAFCVHVLRTRRLAILQLPYWKWLAAFMLVVVLGAFNGVRNGNEFSLVFKDVNGYLFFGIFLVAIQAIQTREHLARLFQAITAGLLMMGAKTVVVLFLFSHSVPFLPTLYRWIRVTGVGEISKMDWNFYRVFFQSQLFDLVFIFILAVVILFQWNKQNVKALLCILFLVFLTTFVSWSRSFWMAFILVAALLLLWLIIKERYRFKQVSVVFAGFFLLLLTTVATVSGILNIPLDGSGWGDASLFRLATDRASDIEGEPAATSRFNLLSPLLKTIRQHPIIGGGFGTTVTYKTHDARALANNPDGLYTTFAFEWGYLDLLTEIGVLGLAVYLGFLWKIFAHGVQLQKKLPSAERSLIIGMLFGLGTLVVVHGVTPYLSHPIGIAYIILVAIVVHIFSQTRNGDIAK